MREFLSDAEISRRLRALADGFRGVQALAGQMASQAQELADLVDPNPKPPPAPRQERLPVV